jgi:hypothetical protein
VWSYTSTAPFAFMVCVWTLFSFAVLFLCREPFKIDISLCRRNGVKDSLCSSPPPPTHTDVETSHKELNISRLSSEEYRTAAGKLCKLLMLFHSDKQPSFRTNYQSTLRKIPEERRSQAVLSSYAIH